MGDDNDDQDESHSLGNGYRSPDQLIAVGGGPSL